MNNKPGAQTTEFKVTLLVILLVALLLALTLSGVVSMEKLKAEVPAALILVGGLVAGAYNLARGMAKYALPPPPDKSTDDDGDGAR